jgi:hypothetical protein
MLMTLYIPCPVYQKHIKKHSRSDDPHIVRGRRFLVSAKIPLYAFFATQDHVGCEVGLQTNKLSINCRRGIYLADSD